MSSPERTCIGCRRSADAAELVRFVRREGTLRFGSTLPGRGAWLCAATLGECAAAAIRRQAFERALGAPLDPGSVDHAVRAAASSVRPPSQNARG